MNVLFPLFLYTSVFLEDERAAPPSTVGTVLPGKPADGRLVVGDRIVSVDEQPVSSFPEVQRLVSARAGKPTRFELARDGKVITVTITPADEALVTEPRELGLVEHVGQIGFHPSFVAPVIGVPRTDSPAYRAGLRTFDRIVSINGHKIDRYIDLVNALAANKGDAVVVALERPVDVAGALGGLVDVAVLDPEVATLTLSPRGPNGSTNMDEDARARDVLVRAGIESADLYAAFVPEGSSEWKAGLRAGDRITQLDGQPQRLWQTMEDDLIFGANKRRSVAWTRAGEPMQGAFALRKEEWDDPYGQHYERYVFRTTHFCPYALGETVPDPSPLLHAAQRSLEETGARCPPDHAHVRATPAGKAPPLERQRPHHHLRHGWPRRCQRRALVRVGHGLHLDQHWPRQPLAHPGSRWRAPLLHDHRGGAATPLAASRSRDREPRGDERADPSDGHRVQE